MKLTIDTTAQQVICENGDGSRSLSLYSPEAFELLSREWVRLSWVQKYSYNFTWLGRPIIQLPDDMIRIQEVIYQVKPDVIVETGVAHGGSLIYYAGLCKLIGNGRVIGIDIEIRQHNRLAIESHILSDYITLVEGSSTDPLLLDQVRTLVQPGERVLVLLDSCHTKSHVAAELEAYCMLVSRDSYLIATDGIMADLAGLPRSQPDWTWNNPKAAVQEFVAKHSEFVLCEPPLLFNEGMTSSRITHWPCAFLRRIC
jgi:cephalosporin hydroxylase